jgi:16S rRNA (adenine1518-N6/adenine1519-N6)-dimethyltransferase
MSAVKPKKHLGQHFLKDKNIAQRIVELLTLHGGYQKVLEIGPGMGVLTDFLIQHPEYETYLIDIDKESIEYLNKHYPMLEGRIIEGDFLKIWLEPILGKEPIAIIGNFPYNISSQIFFKVLENRRQVTEVVCMLQKEVAERIASPPGSKVYGILSVLLQAFYDIKYQFKVDEHVFNPPPRVKSAVISLKRNNREKLDCNEKFFFSVVKQGFNNRRKTLRNALKPIGLPEVMLTDAILDKRAEQLSVDDFIALTARIEQLKAESN